MMLGYLILYIIQLTIKSKAMLHFLGIVALIAIILIVAFFITKAVLSVKYGWPAKIPFYVVEFLTAEKKSNYFTIGYLINGECYRLKLRQFKTYEIAKENIPLIVNAANRYNTKKKLIAASHCIPEDRLISISDTDIVPNWVIKIMTFSITSCFSKTSK